MVTVKASLLPMKELASLYGSKQRDQRDDVSVKANRRRLSAMQKFRRQRPRLLGSPGSVTLMTGLLLLLLQLLLSPSHAIQSPGVLLSRDGTTTTNMPSAIAGPIDDAQCSIEDIESANDAQLFVILQDLKKTSFFRSFVVDLDHKCPLQRWTSAGDAQGAEDDEEEEFECSGGKEELDEDAEPLCTVQVGDDGAMGFGGGQAGLSFTADLESNVLSSLAQDGFESKAQKDTFAWKTHSDLVVDGGDCDDPTHSDTFWMDICSNIVTGTNNVVNLALNPERNTGYNGTHIWNAIYEENCIIDDDDDMCFEERVLYRLFSGLHTSTTLSIAINYYPPSKRKGREDWESNPKYFMEKFGDNPEYIQNLHFSYVVLLRALQKATPFLKSYEIKTGNVTDDQSATRLLGRLLDSAILDSCSNVFSAFDESLMFKESDDEKVQSLQKSFKGVFHNVSSILDCVQCQQCKLHGKMTMLGYGAALKVLFMNQPSLERNEVVALINTVGKFSESIRQVRELTHLYWEEELGKTQFGGESSSVALAADIDPASLEVVEKAVALAASLGRDGRIPWEREAELVQLALNRKPELLILAKHYAHDANKFLHLSSTITSLAAQQPEYEDPDAIIVGSGLAGLAAALNILDRGGRVVVLEKEHLLGGNSNKASSGINACCLEEDNTTDTLEMFRADTTRSAGDSARPDLIETLVTNSGDAVSWLKNRVGVDLSLLAQLGGHGSKRTHRPSNGMAGAEIMFGLQKAVKAYEKSGKVQIILDARVTGLLNDDSGRVIGVKYTSLKDDSDQEIELYGDNVVLATGGFAADRSHGSYLERHRPELLKMPATAGPFSTGDGISLATSLGAATVDMDKVQIHPTGWVDPADPDNTSKILAAELMRGVGGILLNEKGERFCNELGTRAYVTDKMLSHNPAYAKTGKWDQTADIPTFYLILSSSAAADGKKHVDLYSHKGLLEKVDGVAALAEKTGLSKKSLLATLRQYRQDASKGKDSFGKTSFRGVPQEDLESETFYVGRVTPVLHYCMGGITIDVEGNVLNEDGDIIPGLHAAGEVTGGVHGVNRLGGNSLLECTVYGTIIGKKIPVKVSLSSSNTVLTQDAPEKEEKELRLVSLSELEEHNTPEDCWVLIDDIVYDLTEFADEHPAGPASIHELAGKNGSEAFFAVHNSHLLDDFEDEKIGRIAPQSSGKTRSSPPKSGATRQAAGGLFS